ncbi:MAG: hypothetical protein GEU74_05080 [Nitriliruptorales bacterium]|nr:hypothetical protein [Nitriliruptorales bacterium]
MLAAAALLSGGWWLLTGGAPPTDARVLPVAVEPPGEDAERLAVIRERAARFPSCSPAALYEAPGLNAFAPAPDGRAPPCYVIVPSSAPAPGSAAARTRPVRVDGLRLVHRRDLRRICADAAQAVGHAVPCPRLLPAGGFATICAATCTPSGGFRLHAREFQLPQGDCTTCAAAIALTSARVGTQAAETLTFCDGGPLADGRDGQWICPPAISQSIIRGSYLMQRGVHDDVAYAVKVHTSDVDQRAVLGRIFAGVSFVEPREGQPGS